jgi:hypothetical protein
VLHTYAQARARVPATTRVAMPRSGESPVDPSATNDQFSARLAMRAPS